MNKFHNIVLLTDLDGTLLNSHEQVSPETLEALDYFTREGGQFGVCTGRNRQNACAILPPLPLNGMSIFSNGSMLYDFSGEQVVATRDLDPVTIAPFLRHAMAVHPTMGVHLHTDLDSFFLSDPATSPVDVVENHLPCGFATVEESMDFHWIKLMFSGDKTTKSWLWDQSVQLCQELNVDMVDSAPRYTEFLPKGSNKGTMVRHLRSLLDPAATIVGVGDYYNDVEFIREVDVGIYTENAPEQLKSTATHICAHHDHHALADVIHRILS